MTSIPDSSKNQLTTTHDSIKGLNRNQYSKFVKNHNKQQQRPNDTHCATQQDSSELIVYTKDWDPSVVEINKSSKSTIIQPF